MEANSLPFTKVVHLVEKQTGYNIQFDQTLNTSSISGKFVDIPLTKFFQRILKKRNYSLELKEESKEIIIHTFDKKSNIIRSNYLDNVTKDKIRRTDETLGHQNMQQPAGGPEYVDEISGMAHKQIAEQHEKQRLNASRVSKSDTFDHVSGASVAEIEAIHAKQRLNVSSE